MAIYDYEGTSRIRRGVQDLRLYVLDMRAIGLYRRFQSTSSMQTPPKDRIFPWLINWM